MQAHANDLRAEVADGWSALVATEGADPPDHTTLDAFVHQAATDWRHCALSAPVKRLLECAEKITLTPAEVTERDVADLRTAGWSDRAIHDTVQVVAYFNYINRVADALGVAPEEGLPGWGQPS